LRFRLEESQGHFDEAEESLSRAVERNPSWRNVSWLASFELERGKISKSRRHLEELLSRTPDNVWALEQLAYLELLYGDLERAERIYNTLAQSHPQRSYYTNLGQARSLRGHYKEAEKAYSAALEIDPGHVIVMLNLADTELDLGNRTSAEALYGAVLQSLEDTRGGASLPPQEEMMKAQCLARLGRSAEARESARNALSRAPRDAQRLFEAALVHSVIGDRSAALGYAKDAVSRGMRPRWFQVSAFEPLRQEPGFQALLRPDGPEQGR
jgi:tetratricopeptide (TPR) repeat protein